MFLTLIHAPLNKLSFAKIYFFNLELLRKNFNYI